MKFVVTRTSCSCYDCYPCPEATHETVLRQDRRTCDDPVKIPAYRGNVEKARSDWFDYGLNHRVENGQITRDIPKKVAIVELNTLDDLVRFVDTHGTIVFQHGRYEYPEIEIYDGYRE